MQKVLNCPVRPQKPRTAGITSILDNGLPFNLFKDYVLSFEGVY